MNSRYRKWETIGETEAGNVQQKFTEKGSKEMKIGKLIAGILVETRVKQKGQLQ